MLGRTISTISGQSGLLPRAAPDKYFTLPNDEGAALYALFTQHANLNFFASDKYSIHLRIKNDTYNTATLSLPILVRGKNNNKKFDVITDQIVGGGAEGSIIMIGATFRLNKPIETVEVKFANYVVKSSSFNMKAKAAHKAKLTREQQFTRLGAPILRMKEPVLVDELESDQCGAGFLVMKQLFGEDLRTVINNQYANTNSPPAFPKLTTYNVLSLILQLGERLQELHEGKKLVHRDLKPENIFITNDLKVQPIDFGFTKRRGEKDPNLCGSPVYVDPSILELILTHQLDNYPSWPDAKKRNLLTEKSDMFIYGIIIAELLNIMPPLICNRQMTRLLQLAYNRNCNIVLDVGMVHLPGLDKCDIVELIELVNQLFNTDPDKRPDAKTFVSLLKAHLESLLKQLSNTKDFARTQLKCVPENSDVQIKLKSLSSLLLFKPANPASVCLAANPNSTSSHTASNESLISGFEALSHSDLGSSTGEKNQTEAPQPKAVASGAARMGLK